MRLSDLVVTSLCATSQLLLGGCYADDVLARNLQQPLPGDAACLAQLANAAPAAVSQACPALPAPAGDVICVGPERAAELAGIVESAAPNTTLLLADGTYDLSVAPATSALSFRAAGVSLRSASGDAARVILDGKYLSEVLIRIAASNVMIADVTLQHALHHAIQITPPDAGLTNPRLERLRIFDAGNRFVKVDAAPGTPGAYADDGSLNCSTLELTAEGRTHIQPTDTACDMGGLAASGVRGWVVRDNSFRGLYCTSGGVAQHAVYFADGSRDSLVERNLIIDCARGIGFGSPAAAPRTYDDDPYPAVAPISHYDGIIRNNMLSASVLQFDTGIELAQARGAKVLHNSIFHPQTAYSSIDFRYPTTSVSLSNNIVIRLTTRDQGQAEQLANLEAAPGELFVDAPHGDLHLAPSASAAIDQGSVLPDAGLDIDGAPHEVGAPDIGADEVGAP